MTLDTPSLVSDVRSNSLIHRNEFCNKGQLTTVDNVTAPVVRYVLQVARDLRTGASAMKTRTVLELHEGWNHRSEGSSWQPIRKVNSRFDILYYLRAVVRHLYS